MPDWLKILLFSLAGLIVAIAIIFTILILVSNNKKKKKNKAAEGLYKNIIEAVGNKENISDVSYNGSRLSIVLVDNNKLDNEKLDTMKKNGIGIVKSSKKITLVVGELASNYCNAILKELEK